MYDEKRRNGELAAARDDGRAEGLAEGLEQGLAEGLERGQAQAQAEMARKMLASGMPVEQIIQFTGLTLETIESLK